MDTLHLATWLDLALVALSASLIAALVLGLAYLSVGRSRHRWMRLLFFSVQLVLIGLIVFVNLRADAELQARSRRRMDRKRLDRLAALMLDARRLYDGRFPPSIDALREIPAFREELLTSPLQGTPYQYERLEEGVRARLRSDPSSRSPWWRETAGHHELTLDAETATRPITWVQR